VLESHRRDVSVVFCDLRGFTAFSELAEPEEVMLVLREYHTKLGVLINKFEGTVERFSGDGLLVVFNDPLPCPDPSIRAVQMALEMRDEVAKLSVKWSRPLPTHRDRRSESLRVIPQTPHLLRKYLINSRRFSLLLTRTFALFSPRCRSN
jgi:hypothetical protein